MPHEPNQPYKKPPIIEAVIAVHLSAPLEQKDIDTFARKSQKRLPVSEDIIQMGALYNAATKHHTSNVNKIGYKLSSAERTRVIMIQPLQIGVIQLAPYTDWGTFYSEARSHWEVLKKIVGYKPVSRVSTRYINRIDIPVSSGGYVDLQKYLNVGLSLPPYAQAMSLQNFSLNSSLNNSHGENLQVLQVATVPSPLIDHLSITIDIDVATTGQVPLDDGKLWDLINSLRKYKNDLFESCITADTRNLFQ